MPASLPRGPAVAPSILSADFARLGEQVETVLAAGARVIHVDVMDGAFVPPITIGPIVAGAIAPQVHEAGALVDVHLMIERPERQIEAFATAGADVITVHAEATPHADYALREIRAAGCRAGLAICPATPPAVYEEVVGALDVALCMSVNPGWGGQQFIERSIEKIARIRELLPDEVVIEVDGGIDPSTAGPCVAAGATLLVAGSAVFGKPDSASAYREITERAAAALSRA